MSNFQMPSYDPQWTGQPVQLSAPSKPPQITMAFRLLLAAAALMVISTILSIMSLSSADSKQKITEEIQKQGTALPDGADMDQLVSAATTVGIVVAGLMLIVGLALYVLIAIFINKGAGWARIAGLVLAVFSLSGLISLTFPAGIFGILQILAGIGAIVLCFIKPGSQYFTEMKNYKLANKQLRQ